MGRLLSITDTLINMTLLRDNVRYWLLKQTHVENLTPVRLQPAGFGGTIRFLRKTSQLQVQGSFFSIQVYNYAASGTYVVRIKWRVSVQRISAKCLS